VYEEGSTCAMRTAEVVARRLHVFLLWLYVYTVSQSSVSLFSMQMLWEPGVSERCRAGVRGSGPGTGAPHIQESAPGDIHRHSRYRRRSG
jgi:hypothetical protein